VMENGLNLIERVAICFAAELIGRLAVVFFSYILLELGLSAIFGVKAPIHMKSPDIYRPLFWALATCRTGRKELIGRSFIFDKGENNEAQ
jgi:hypothetical protein